MNRAQVHVKPHMRSRPYSAEFEAVHAELEAARRVDRILDEFVGRLEIEIERDLAEGVR